jgi:sugar lactone lactonase YvrE
VFGQADFTSTKFPANNATASNFFAQYVAVDSSGNVYVADDGGLRVLEFPSDCAAMGCSASRVFGQTSFTAEPRGGPPTSSKLWYPAGVAVDGGGNVYVADETNNRVLEFPGDCARTGCSAVRVFGQTDFTSNRGCFACTASTLASPHGLAVDGSGNVWVVDYGSNRVLEFPAGCASTGCSASSMFEVALVSGPVSAGTMDVALQDVAVDSSGDVYVADPADFRVLEFPSGCAATGCSAIRVFGQHDFTSRLPIQPPNASSLGVPLTVAGDSIGGVAVDVSGNVYIADTANNRVLQFPPSCPAAGCAATRVFGQANFGPVDAPGTNEPPIPNPPTQTPAADANTVLDFSEFVGMWQRASVLQLDIQADGSASMVSAGDVGTPTHLTIEFDTTVTQMSTQPIVASITGQVLTSDDDSFPVGSPVSLKLNDNNTMWVSFAPNEIALWCGPEAPVGACD